MGWRRGKFSLAALLAQGAFLVLFILFVRYDKIKDSDDAARASHYYPVFQDIHVMILLGFGFLVTFLKRYSFGGVALNLLLCAFVIQWATLMGGLLRLKADEWKINVSVETLLLSDVACVAVLITFGALLGKASPLQLLIIAACEVVIFQVNEWICSARFMAADAGRSMFIHCFGALFGLVVSKILNDGSIYESPAKEKDKSNYHADVFTIIGTLFLWCFWPSFNAGLAPAGEAQHRAILNTYFALCACTVTTFIVSAVLDEEDRFEVSHIQNATLAGGVAVGTVADMVIHPWGALIVGIAAGLVAVFGFRCVTPFLSNYLRIHDSRGVFSLHGLPGLVSALGGVVVAALATEQSYGATLYEIFPGRAPSANTTAYIALKNVYPDLRPGHGWSAGIQAGMQGAALCTTLLFALIGGSVTGIIVKIPIWDQPDNGQLFEDKPFLKIAVDSLPEVHVQGDDDDEEALVQDRPEDS